MQSSFAGGLPIIVPRKIQYVERLYYVNFAENMDLCKQIKFGYKVKHQERSFSKDKKCTTQFITDGITLLAYSIAQ